MSDYETTLLQMVNHLIVQHPNFAEKIPPLMENRNNNKDWNRFNSQRKNFIDMGGIITHSKPIISEYASDAGDLDIHYFNQDLLVAQFIHEKKPTLHFDVGSRIDGFVAHVAAFRPITIVDIRQLKKLDHANIKYIQHDILSDTEFLHSSTDSLSCLHALEHFGLGRYGDPLDPKGHIKGYNSLLRMLRRDGILYISFPIGRQNEVHFNAHRVFHPLEIFSWANSEFKIHLERFDFVDDSGKLHKQFNLNDQIPDVSYGCGIYTLRKV